MKAYKPQARAKEILDQGYKFIETVEYRPTLRWLFYRLAQVGVLSKTKKTNNGKIADYLLLIHLTSTARKRFYGNWKPWTLSDDTRTTYIRGWPEDPKPAKPDLIKDQENYVEIWFESDTMINQIYSITKNEHVTMVSFKGDATVDYKWTIAQRLHSVHDKYPDKPIVILYFGDCDTKGKEIPQNAIRDIRRWVSGDINFQVCGLTVEQAQRFNVPVNPFNPRFYQWVALEEKDARTIILSNLRKYWTTPEGDTDEL